MVLESQNQRGKQLDSVTSEICYTAIINTLSTYLPIKINGSLTVEQLFAQLTCLATHRESIHSSTKLFPNFLSETALRHHLKKFDMESLVASSSAILLEHIRHHLKPDKSYECAIDFTDDPYYGKIDDMNVIYVRKGQRKKSTYKFYTYATLSLVERNEKFILGVLPVEKGAEVVKYVRELVSILEKYRIRPKVIYMDGGFFSIDVMTYLKERRIPFIIPAPNKEGRLHDLIINTKKQFRCSYRVGGVKKRYVDITLGILKLRIDKKTKRKKDTLAYAMYGVESWSLTKVADKYRHRFSIEATYRIRNGIKPKTSTKNATIRYLFALISFLIENIWVSFQIRFFTKKQRGWKVIDEDKFPVSVFVMLVNEALRDVVGWVTSVKAIRDRR